MSSTPYPPSIRRTPCKSARLFLGKGFCPVWMLDQIIPLPEDGKCDYYLL